MKNKQACEDALKSGVEGIEKLKNLVKNNPEPVNTPSDQMSASEINKRWNVPLEKIDTLKDGSNLSLQELRQRVNIRLPKDVDKEIGKSIKTGKGLGDIKAEPGEVLSAAHKIIKANPESADMIKNQLSQLSPKDVEYMRANLKSNAVGLRSDGMTQNQMLQTLEEQNKQINIADAVHKLGTEKFNPNINELDSTLEELRKFDGDVPKFGVCPDECITSPLAACDQCYMSLSQIEQALTKAGHSLNHMPCPSQCAEQYGDMCTFVASC